MSNISSPYGISLQQFYSNDSRLNELISEVEPDQPSIVNLFGLDWNTVQDNSLNVLAATEREILSSIAANFDPFNFCGPILNRARLFLHNLQCQKCLGWDDRLPSDGISTWRNIARHVNSSPTIHIDRFFGNRSDE